MKTYVNGKEKELTNEKAFEMILNDRSILDSIEIYKSISKQVKDLSYEAFMSLICVLIDDRCESCMKVKKLLLEDLNNCILLIDFKMEESEK